MILACLATAALGAALPSDSPRPEEGTALVLRVEETRLTLENPGDVPVLLLFGFEEREPRLARWLGPGERAASAFPRGATEELFVEVIQPDERGLAATGALRLVAPDAGAVRELWVRRSGLVLGALAGEPISPLHPEESLVPASAQPYVHAPDAALPATAPAMLHVPIPQSTGGSNGDKPPKLEEKPLPPV